MPIHVSVHASELNLQLTFFEFPPARVVHHLGHFANLVDFKVPIFVFIKFLHPHFDPFYDVRVGEFLALSDLVVLAFGGTSAAHTTRSSTDARTDSAHIDADND